MRWQVAYPQAYSSCIRGAHLVEFDVWFGLSIYVCTSVKNIVPTSDLIHR